MKFEFQEVSAKSGDNIQNLFKEVTNKLVGEDASQKNEQDEINNKENNNNQNFNNKDQESF